MSSAPILEVEAVTRRFGDVTAVDRLSFQVQPGEVFTLLGPSGCGKSTTLRMVAGLEHPDEGQLRLKGRVIASTSQGIFLAPEKRNMGMVFQSYAIWPHMTVFANVAFPLRLRHESKATVEQRVGAALATVGLAGLEERPATMLSGGQQQRVALARAIVYNPEMLLLDEPLSNLDAKLREQMRVELRTLQRRLGIAVLFVTHDQTEAMTLSDRVALLDHGHLEQVGSPSEVYQHPATPFVRDFLGRALVFEGTVQPDATTLRVELIGEPECTLLLDAASAVQVNGSSRVIVACRPEDVHLEASHAPYINRVPVVVEEAAYLGERLEYNVRTGGGRALQLFGSRRHPHPVGSSLDLVIDPTEATVWPQ